MRKKKTFIKVLCFLLVFIILIAIILFVFINKFKQEEKQEIVTVACVGDSLTFFREFEGEKFINYPTVLQERLGEGYDVTNYGQAGTCVRTDGYYPYRSLRVYRCSVESNADIVVVMIGTNDIWDVNWIDKEHFRKEYLELVDSYMQGEKKPEIYLCTLPKIFMPDGTPLGTGCGERINILSDVIREVANENGYHIIDMNQITSEHPEWYWIDLLHFSNDGARNIAMVVQNAITQ